MARRQTPTLTEAELKVMDVVWDIGEASVHEVVKRQPKGRALAYNTVLTTMRILEKKGYLTHEKSGRAFVYKPLVDRRQARTRAVRHMIKSFFDDSPELLLLNVLKDEKLSESELERLKNMVEESDNNRAGEDDRGNDI
jgi:predicted transcriptional regulator